MLVVGLVILKYTLVIAAILILAFIAFIMFSFRDVVPFVATPRRIVEKMIELADIKASERIVDLGSGTGRIIIAVAKRHKNNLVIGIEKSLTLRLINKFFLYLHPLIKKRIQVINEDFFNVNLSQLDVIFCFLTPEGMRRLASKFSLLKSGSRLLSYMFPLENYQGFTEYIEEVTAKDSIYLYKKI